MCRARRFAVPDEGVDFSVFGVGEIRDLLKNKACCLRAGFSSNHIIIRTFNAIRDHYLQRVGLPTYLSQMLGRLSTVQMRYCTLYTEDCHRIEVGPNGSHNQSVQRFLMKQFEGGTLPFVVEVRSGEDPERVEVRYL